VFAFEQRIVAAGSRSYNNYDEFDFMMRKLTDKLDKSNCVIISGDALDGPDAMVIHWAKVNRWKYSRFPADWDKFKKAAGFIRNVDMKKHATRVIVFWDLVSRGAEHMFTISNADKSIQTTLIIVFADNTPYA